ncbi:MAG: N-formylglutamate amidohydrolase [Sphingomicrobium sp.]
MNRPAESALLGHGDPPPVDIFNPAGASSFLLIGDHAGNLVPVGLDQLGLPQRELERHIGWDIGIAELGRQVGTALDATFIAQRYSRLVIDCNRSPGRADAMPEVSDGTAIAPNVGLSEGARAERVVAIQEPYQQAIADDLARRDAAGEVTVLVALHSFTPVMGGVARPWHAGVLHDLGDTRFALAVIERLRGESGLIVGDNEPYRMDVIDHTIPLHAYPRGRPYLELEVRQDLLGTPDGIVEWCDRLARLLPAAAADAAIE